MLDGGQAHGPLRLITVINEADDAAWPGADGRQVNLIHETLIRSKAPDAQGKRQPFWPTLWTYIEQHQDRAARRERLRLLAREWQERRGMARLAGLAGWQDVFGFRGLAAPGSVEWRFLRWSRITAAIQACMLVLVLGIVGDGLIWAWARGQSLDVAMDRFAYRLWKTPPEPRWAEVQAGSFVMGREGGSADEQPPHPVTFGQPFDLAATEVTFAQWDACVADGGCNGYSPDDEGWGRGDQPVINVSWDDAQAFAAWLTAKSGRHCRLPSEAEWEYACRAGSNTGFALPAPAGSDDIAGRGLANCDGCGSEWDNTRTAPVGRFPANAWDLHDMHGNVWEWVEDCWHSSYENAAADGRSWGHEDGGDCSSRALRGGSWSNSAVSSRCASRSQLGTGDGFDFIGFRLVCSSPSSGTYP